MKIIIVGGGIGGLAAAIALGREGHDLEIYEKATEFTEIGAGIQITPNASRVLLRWGLEKYLSDLQSRSPCFKVRRWDNGSLIGCMETERHETEFGAPYVQLHRADLQSALLRAARDLGVMVFTGCPVVDYDLEAPAVTLESGQRKECDLIIAADGSKSPARRLLRHTGHSSTIASELAVVRATLDVQEVEKQSSLQYLLDDVGLNLWIGPHRHAVIYGMRGESLLNMVLEFPEPRDPSKWPEGSHKEEVEEVFRGWDPNLQKLLGMVKATMKWPLRFSVPLPRWSSESGRFVLLGDAAHVMPSFLAQGAAMAIEDAALLAALIPASCPASEIPELVRRFESLRRDRKMEVHELSLHNLELYHLEDGEKQDMRDRACGEAPDLMPIWQSIRDQARLYNYDVLLEVGS